MADDFFKIKVVGVGGAGGNAVSRVKKVFSKEGVEFIAVNTDLQDLKYTKADFKIPIGENVTYGLGAGMNPLLGKKAALESKEKLKDYLLDGDLVFLVAGLGGGTGTGALPVIAKFLKEMNILTIALVTLPFSFEGASRKKISKKGLREIYLSADSVISVENDKILKLAQEKGKISVAEAFSLSDEVLLETLYSILDLLTYSGPIPLSFESISEILKDSKAMFASRAKTSGQDRMEKALKLALSSPFLSLANIKEVKGIIFSVAGEESVTLEEINHLAKYLEQKTSKNTKIAFGIAQDPSLRKGEIKLTLILTGFKRS